MNKFWIHWCKATNIRVFLNTRFFVYVLWPAAGETENIPNFFGVPKCQGEVVNERWGTPHRWESVWNWNPLFGWWKKKSTPGEINGWSRPKNLNQNEGGNIILNQTSGGLGNPMLIFQGVLWFFFLVLYFFGSCPTFPENSIDIAPENRPKLTPKRKSDRLPSINFQELLLLVWGGQIFFLCYATFPFA